MLEPCLGGGAVFAIGGEDTDGEETDPDLAAIGLASTIGTRELDGDWLPLGEPAAPPGLNPV